MRCSACHHESDGNFCPSCGATLRARCGRCDAALQPAARFCTACGARARSGGAWPWILAAVVLVAAAGVAAVVLPGSSGSVGASQTGAPPGFDRAPPPLTGSLRDQADTLFDRVMRARSAGDLERAEFFLPMAVAAYRQSGTLDDDGLYHLSLLEAAGGDAASALATAERILARSPDHLLGLGAAADAALLAGDSVAAESHYRRFLDAYDAELAAPRSEYGHHSGVLPVYLEEARSFPGTRD